MKVQSIVLVIIILLLLYIVIRYVFADVNTMSGLMSGTTEQIISPSTLATPSGLYASNFAYNIWFYIDNYNYKSGDEKILLVRTDAGMSGVNSIRQLNPFPAITFDANTNNMKVYVSNSSGSVGARDGPGCTGNLGKTGGSSTVGCCKWDYNGGQGFTGYLTDVNGNGRTVSAVGAIPQAYSGGASSPSGWWKTGTGNPEITPSNAASWSVATGYSSADFGNGCASSGHYKRYIDKTQPLGVADTDYPYTYTYGASLDGYPLNKYGGKIIPTVATDGSFSQYDLNASYNNDEITVPNIPVQAWTMVTVNINQLNVEVYINGKLQTTGQLDYIANPSASAPVYITPNGGFAGWTSKFGYYPNSLNPQDIWNLYQNGYGGSWLSNLFGSYNVKISLIENGNPSSSVTI